MKTLKITALALLMIFSVDAVMAQMIRNKAVHFSRRRVKQHHLPNGAQSPVKK